MPGFLLLLNGDSPQLEVLMAMAGKQDGRNHLIEKLRHLVAHPATSGLVRDIAKDKLAILSPRNPEAVPGSPQRRERDAAETQSVIAHLVKVAWTGVDRTGGGPHVRPRRMDKRFDDARLQEKHILDILA